MVDVAMVVAGAEAALQGWVGWVVVVPVVEEMVAGEVVAMGVGAHLAVEAVLGVPPLVRMEAGMVAGAKVVEVMAAAGKVAVG